MRRTRSRHVGRSVLSGATTPNRNGLVIAWNPRTWAMASLSHAMSRPVTRCQRVQTPLPSEIIDERRRRDADPHLPGARDRHPDILIKQEVGVEVLVESHFFIGSLAFPIVVTALLAGSFSLAGRIERGVRECAGMSLELLAPGQGGQCRAHDRIAGCPVQVCVGKGSLGGTSGAIRIRRLPRFSPRYSPAIEPGACSIPSRMSSR